LAWAATLNTQPRTSHDFKNVFTISFYGWLFG
jgi:hypothetical protein